jgi:hypothetical protein
MCNLRSRGAATLIRARFDPCSSRRLPRLLPKSPDTSLEVLALRQLVAVLKRRRRRPCLNRLDRFFWIPLRSIWPRWSDVLVIVKPETVIRWHRVGFRLYWRWRSRTCDGLPKVSEEIRTLIRTMATENGNWGAPKIQGELGKLGFEVPNARLPDFFEGCGHIAAIRPNAGCRSWPIIEKRSSRLTFYLTHSDPPIPVLLLRDRAQPAQDPVLQRRSSSDLRLGRSTTA